MQIKRIVNGQEVPIILTNHELWSAYEEYCHIADLIDLDIYLSDHDIDEPMTDEQRECAAYQFREFLYYDWQESMEAAYKYAMEA